jgi:hypothetical protein
MIGSDVESTVVKETYSRFPKLAIAVEPVALTSLPLPNGQSRGTENVSVPSVTE